MEDPHLWIRTARRGGNVKRCHTVPLVSSHYNNACHTFNCLVIAEQVGLKEMENYLPPDYNQLEEFTSLNLYLLTHDLNECDLGDIPATAKWGNPELKQVNAALEQKWDAENIPSGLRYMIARMHPTTLQLAHSIDTLELAYFALEERMRGNLHATPVFTNCVNALRTKAEPFPTVTSLLNKLVQDWEIVTSTKINF